MGGGVYPTEGHRGTNCCVEETFLIKMLTLETLGVTLSRRGSVLSVGDSFDVQSAKSFDFHANV